MVDAINAFDAGLALDPGNKDIVANRDAAAWRRTGGAGRRRRRRRMRAWVGGAGGRAETRLLPTLIRKRTEDGSVKTLTKLVIQFSITVS
jgi:hypothetical protein